MTREQLSKIAIGTTLLGTALVMTARSDTTTEAPEPSTTTTTVAEARVLDPDGLYLNLMWHQHQPLYPKDAYGVVTRPWVRVHATKDYYDMAALIAEYPDVHATFNLTPVLLLQLEELANGTKDLYWVLSEVPANDLSADQKQFIQDRFFDTNAKIVVRFPRYEELIEKRDRPDQVEFWRNLRENYLASSSTRE